MQSMCHPMPVKLKCPAICRERVLGRAKDRAVDPRSQVTMARQIQPQGAVRLDPGQSHLALQLHEVQHRIVRNAVLPGS